MKKYRGGLFVIEGPDGAGKSSIVKHLSDELSLLNLEVKLYAFPGSCEGSLGRLVYNIHHNPLSFGVSDIAPEALQALHIAAHIDTIETQIRPSLDRGEIVLMDRFWWSTWVYGLFHGAAEEVLDALIKAERIVWGEYAPAHLFLIDRDNSLREDSKVDWAGLRRLYSKLAQRENSKYDISVVANDGQEKEAAETILKIIKNSLI